MIGQSNREKNRDYNFIYLDEDEKVNKFERANFKL